MQPTPDVMNKYRQSKPTTDDAALPISVSALGEMEKLALACPLDLSRLSYTQIQQTLTLYSLIKYFEQFGLKAPIELDINGK